MDCARPCRPPEAKCVIREASGCSTDEPNPTSATATNTTGNDPAYANRNRPAAVESELKGKYHTLGRLSNTTPKTGWNTEAQI